MEISKWIKSASGNCSTRTNGCVAKWYLIFFVVYSFFPFFFTSPLIVASLISLSIQNHDPIKIVLFSTKSFFLIIQFFCTKLSLVHVICRYRFINYIKNIFKESRYLNAIMSFKSVVVRNMYPFAETAQPKYQ